MLSVVVLANMGNTEHLVEKSLLFSKDKFVDYCRKSQPVNMQRTGDCVCLVPTDTLDLRLRSHNRILGRKTIKDRGKGSLL